MTRKRRASIHDLGSRRLEGAKGMRRRCQRRHSILHRDRPAEGVKVAVVVPAQEDSIVRVGRATVLPRLDVVDFAPRRGHHAAGNYTTTVASDYGATLMMREYPLRCRKRQNPPIGVSDDALDCASTPDV